MAPATKPKKIKTRVPLGLHGPPIRPAAPKRAAASGKPASKATLRFVQHGPEGPKKKPGPAPKGGDTPVEPLIIRVVSPLHNWFKRVIRKLEEADETALRVRGDRMAGIKTQKDAGSVAIFDFLERHGPELRPADFDPHMVFGPNYRGK